MITREFGVGSESSRAHRRKIWSDNPLERLNNEVKLCSPTSTTSGAIARRYLSEGSMAQLDNPPRTTSPHSPAEHIEDHVLDTHHSAGLCRHTRVGRQAPLARITDVTASGQSDSRMAHELRSRPAAGGSTTDRSCLGETRAEWIQRRPDPPPGRPRHRRPTDHAQRLNRQLLRPPPTPRHKGRRLGPLPRTPHGGNRPGSTSHPTEPPVERV